MHITLINPPQAFTKYQVAADVALPLGIAYLAAVAQQKKHQVTAVDAVGEAPEKQSPYKADYGIRGLNFDDISSRVPNNTGLIGISNLFTFAFPVVLDLTKKLKEDHPDVPIVLGGAHPSATAEDTLRNDSVDYVIKGEGEVTLFELLDHLEGRKQLSEIDGVGYKVNGVPFATCKEKLIQDLDALPFPARELFPQENYWETKEGHGPTEGKWTPMLSSRGCPYGCTYCTPGLWLRKWRQRSSKNTVDEMEYCYKKWGITQFQFEDENMTVSKERMLEFADEILKRKLPITWNTPNGVRASVTDKEMVQRMKDSGCNHLVVAPESGSKRVLTEIAMKTQPLESVTSVVKNAHDVGIKTACYFILGLPGEKREDMQMTVDYACDLAKIGLDEVAFSLFIPLPGSPLYDKLKAEGKIDYNYASLVSMGDLGKAVSWNDEISSEELQKWRRKAYLKFHMTRALHHPGATLRMMTNVLKGKQETKTERVLESFIKRMTKPYKRKEWLVDVSDYNLKVEKTPVSAIVPVKK